MKRWSGYSGDILNNRKLLLECNGYRSRNRRSNIITEMDVAWKNITTTFMAVVKKE